MEFTITIIVACVVFILQEGLSNIIHGIIFRSSSGIKIGDRVDILVDGKTYTGILKKRKLRHIVINDIVTNSEIIIPNVKADSSIISNAYNGKENVNKYLVTIPISYEDAVCKDTSKLIKQIIRAYVEKCEYTVDKENVQIIIDLKDSSVNYTFFVHTLSVENNFKACSWIKENVIQNLAKNNIYIPYNKLELID